MNIKETFTKHLFDLQDQICRSLEDVDGKAKFVLICILKYKDKMHKLKDILDRKYIQTFTDSLFTINY